MIKTLSKILPQTRDNFLTKPSNRIFKSEFLSRCVFSSQSETCEKVITCITCFNQSKFVQPTGRVLKKQTLIFRENLTFCIRFLKSTGIPRF
jgi:hypothetical protein